MCDLADVVGEVFQDMHQGFHASYVLALDPPRDQELSRIESIENSHGFLEGLLQARHHHRAGQRASLGKLARADAFIFGAAETRHDPLPKVPRQVKQEIAYAIRVVVGTVPELPRVEGRDGLLQTRPRDVEKVMPGFADERFTDLSRRTRQHAQG